MKRRDLLKRSLVLGGSVSSAVALGTAKPALSGDSKRRLWIVDAHCHAGKGMNYGKDDPNAAPWTTYNDPKWTLRRMAEAGIDQTIIFPISNTVYEKANEEIAQSVQRYKGKLIGFAKHDAKTEVGRIRKLLTREVRDLGLKGLKLHGVPSTEMLDAAAELRIPILFHPSHVDDCHEAVRAYPQVNFILAHLGSFASRDWREHLRAIEAANKYPNLYLDTSSVVFVDYLEKAVRELPAEKLVFGSDGPLVDARVELYKIRLLKLPPEKERLVLGGNILRLLSG